MSTVNFGFNDFKESFLLLNILTTCFLASINSENNIKTFWIHLMVLCRETWLLLSSASVFHMLAAAAGLGRRHRRLTRVVRGTKAWQRRS